MISAPWDRSMHPLRLLSDVRCEFAECSIQVALPSIFQFNIAEALLGRLSPASRSFVLDPVQDKPNQY